MKSTPVDNGREKKSESHAEIAKKAAGVIEIYIDSDQRIYATQDEMTLIILSAIKEAEPGIEDGFINRMAAVFEKAGLDWSDCDGDADPAEVIANYFVNRIQEATAPLEEKIADLEAMHRRLMS